jgi:hypothetical protein
MEYPSLTEVTDSIFVARFDRNGNQKWFRQVWPELPPELTDAFDPVGITVLPDGDVVVAANTTDTSENTYGVLLYLDQDGFGL